MSEKDSVLKKEFSQSDVKRLRNILTKKSGDRISTGVGYTKVEEYHNEGDIWEEGDGRKWCIKNGIKQNITKLDKFKQAYLMPLLCPEEGCNKLMDITHDKPFFLLHKMCLDCVAKKETKLRHEGKWEDYENEIHNDHINNLIKDFLDWFEDDIKEKNQSYITEAGDIENWDGGISKQQREKQKQETLTYLESLKR